MFEGLLEDLRARAQALVEAIFPAGGPAATAVLVAAVVLGLTQCFFGYRTSRGFSFLVGFGVGAWAGAAALGKWVVEPSQVAITGCIVGGGMAVGGLFVSLIWAGLFLLGAALSVAICAVGCEVAGVELGSNWLVVPALLGGTATLAMERSVLVAATALFGAALTVAAAVELSGARDLGRYLVPGDPSSVQNHDALLLGVGSLGLAVWGALAQARAAGPEHEARGGVHGKRAARAAART